MTSISLTTRQRAILREILVSEGTFTTHYLASKLELGHRILRYNLPRIEAWLRMAGVEIIHKPGVGTAIKAPSTLRMRLMAELAGESAGGLVLTGDQRVGELLLELLARLGPIASARIAADAAVSRQTVLTDIEAAETWLRRNGLQLIRRPRVGTWVVGPEINRRIALLRFLDEVLPLKTWLDLWDMPIQNGVGAEVGTPHLRSLLERLPLSDGRFFVEQAERDLDIAFTARSRCALQRYLSIAIDAMRQGRFIAPSAGAPPRWTREWSAAKGIALRIDEQFALTLPEDEIEIIAGQLHCVPREGWTAPVSVDDAIAAGLDDRYIGLARSFVAEASVYLHPWLRIDPRLTMDVARHLGCLVPQLHYGLPLWNRLLATVRDRYPQVFDAAKRSVAEIEREIGGVVANEIIGALSMDLTAALERLRNPRRFRRAFVVGDSSMVGGTELLISRLSAEFPNLEIVGLGLDRIPEQEQLMQAELVVSAVRGLRPACREVVEVSPFLDREDVRAILERLYWAERQDHDAQSAGFDRPSLSDLLRPDCITLDGSAHEWRDVVDLAGKPLVDAGLVEPQYVRAMVDIIASNGPYMLLAPGVALLHARPADGVNALCIGVLVLASGVRFGHDTFDPVDIAFVLGAEDSTSHLTALSQLAGLIRDDEFLSTLREARTPAEVLGLVWRLQTPAASG